MILDTLSWLARKAAIIAIALTGVGLFWLWSRTYWIPAGNMGIVMNYGTEPGELETLDPGYHTLLSPFRSFTHLMPHQTKDVVVRLQKVDLITGDNVSSEAKVDFGYNIDDPIKAATCVENYESEVAEAAKIALADVIRRNGVTFSQLSSAKSDDNTKTQAPKPQNNAATAPVKNSLIDIIRDEFLKAINDITKRWGITVFRFQILNIKASDPTVNQEISESSLVQFQNKNRLSAAEAKAKALKVEAEGEKQAQIIRAEGVQEAAKKLTDANSQIVYEAETRIKIAEKFAQTTGTLMFGTGNIGFFPGSNKPQANGKPVTPVTAHAQAAPALPAAPKLHRKLTH